MHVNVANLVRDCRRTHLGRKAFQNGHGANHSRPLEQTARPTIESMHLLGRGEAHGALRLVVRDADVLAIAREDLRALAQL